jgi:hypothetical protein
MSDPRATVAFDGIDAEFATFIYDNSTITYDATQVGGSSAVGKAVKLSAAATIALTTDGSQVLGKLIKVESDGMCTVQFEGGMTLPGGNGASLTVGKKIVGAVNAQAAGGYIREVATATAAELGLERGMIVDAGTTTAVVVLL